jgi:hypothetical protein
MSADSFRRLLADLLRAATESGLDCYFLHSELTLAGMQLIDNCRVDLVEVEEEGEKAPF